MKDDEIEKFIQHNQKAFHASQPARVGQPIVLMEMNALHSAHIAYSYFANAMASASNARLVAYDPYLCVRWRDCLYGNKRRLQTENEASVYRSFGVSEVLGVPRSRLREMQAKRLARKIQPTLTCKKDIEDIKVRGVRIGDLLYDSYLQQHRKPTVEIKSPEFQRYLVEVLDLFLYWEGFFRKNTVAAINVSHCVYTLAIPLRIAVHHGIPAFQVNVTHAYRLSPKNLFAYNDFFYFRERFAELPLPIQNAGLLEAEKRVERRLKGEIGVDMSYSKKSAFGSPNERRLLRPSTKKKILIATHCFFDSPHSYGDNIFPDFYEWLEFLGGMSQETDYDWYIKTHPDYLSGTLEVIESFLRRYPNITLLPADSSHHQIISEGINLALTVYGTIAFEYALLGIPVINASQNNPHIAYSFNLHAESIGHYKKLLMDPQTFLHKASKRDIYEYYFMKNIYNTENLFFQDYEKTIAGLGGYDKQFTPMVYGKWMSEWTPKRHTEITEALQRFADSGDFRMEDRHMSPSIQPLGKKRKS
jgi:hypothetical protein